MKKLFIIFALSIMSLAVSAQEIRSDRMTSIGRVVSTKSQIIKNGIDDKSTIFMYIDATDFEGEMFYDIGMFFKESISRAFPKKGVILVRVANGEVLEFSNSLDEVNSRDFDGTLLDGKMVYLNSIVFTATREEVDKLKSGISKLRVQTQDDHIDIEYPEDTLGAAIGIHLAKIDAAFAKKKDIRDDF